MLTPYSQSSRSLSASQGGEFVEKIVSDRSGRQFRMVFLATIVNGELKGRLVSVQPLSDSSAVSFPRKQESSVGSQTDILCLPISIPKNIGATAYIPAYAPIVSPFNELFFFTSQPTRAPSK